MSCDALGRPGRARGVDQRQHVLGAERARPTASTSKPGRRRPRRRPARVVPSGASPSTTITCSRSGRSLARLQDAGRGSACSVMTIARARVGDHVLDLLGRVGHVDRERRRRRACTTARSAEVELGPVAEHERDACRPAPARGSARPPASASTRSRSSPQVSVTSSSRGADGDLVGALRGGDAERLGDRRRVDRARVAVAAALHALRVRCSLARTYLRHAEALAARAGRCRSTARRRTGTTTSRKPTTLARSMTRERDRPAADLLGERPEDVAAVERQEREQVDDRQRQRDDARGCSSALRGVEAAIAWRVVS